MPKKTKDKKLVKAREAIESNHKKQALITVIIYVTYIFAYYLSLFISITIVDDILNEQVPIPPNTFLWTGLIALAVGIYNDCFNFNSTRFYKHLYSLYVTLAVTIVAVLALPVAIIDYQVSKLLLFVLFLCQLVVLPIWLKCVTNLHVKIIPPLATLLITDGDGVRVKAFVRRYSKKYNIIKTASAGDKNIESMIKAASAVVIDISDETLKQIALNYCADMDKPTLITPGHIDIMLMHAETEYFGDYMAMFVKSYGFTPGQRFFKRIFDLVIVAIFIVPITIIIIFLCALIYAEDKSNPFYNQKRLTLNGKEYSVFKLRTMIPNAEKVPVLAEKNDSRITKTGKILRALRLDELPQLYNVLLGDMSIVGPRPERAYFYDIIDNQLPEFRKRLKVKAGITGLAQVYGRYATSHQEKLIMDLVYIQSYSLMLDVKLVVETARVLLAKEASEGVKPSN